jgi:predicted DNA-binding transcriptional regulator AlpA
VATDRTTAPGAAPTVPSTALHSALALRPREAAKALGISERLLWSLTAPRGTIPAVRIGTCVLYPVTGLQAWLDRQAQGAPEGGHQ